MTETIIQYVFYVVLLIALAIPLGKYIGKVMRGDKDVYKRQWLRNHRSGAGTPNPTAAKPKPHCIAMPHGARSVSYTHLSK